MNLRAAALAATLIAGAAQAADVEIENYAFAPAKLTVKAGTKVVFVNRDQVPHSVVGSLGGQEIFRSPEQIDEDETYAVVLAAPGEVAFACGLHSSMRGVITVTP